MAEIVSLKEYFYELHIGDIAHNPRYVPCVDEVDAGGYGMVIKAQDQLASPSHEKIFRAVKLLKPEYVKSRKVAKDFLGEINILAHLGHPNITRIVDWGYANYKKKENDTYHKLPFYVMEWIECADLQKVLDSKVVITPEFFELLVDQVLSVLSVFQGQEEPLLHLDIKPDNILVVDGKIVSSQPQTLNENVILRDNVHFLLTDFGKAKLIDSDYIKEENKFDTPGGGIFEYVHPILRKYLRKGNVPKDLFIEMGREFDLYSFGIVLNSLIKRIHQTEKELLDSSWNYFIKDICWWKDEDKNNKPLPLHRYHSAIEARKTAKHLISPYKSIAKDITWYSEEQIPLLRLQGQMTIPFPTLIRRIVDTHEFQRLRNISQLAFTDLIFPSATHTRFAHSIGAYNYARQHIEHLKKQPLFLYLFTEKDIMATLLMALLHDIGHYPFAHYIEEMAGIDVHIRHELFSEKYLTGELDYLEQLKRGIKFFGPLIPKISSFCLGKLSKQSVGDIITESGLLENISRIQEGKGYYSILRSIVNGPLDCDKLDYLIRDGQSSGVPYADSVDVERFMSSITINTEILPEADLAITAKGRSAVESLLTARYNLFTEVYWHKTCRAASAMVKEAFWLANHNFSIDEFTSASVVLGDKEFILWLSEKLQNDEIAYDLLLGGLGIFNQRSLYKRFRTYSSVWSEAKKGQMHQRFCNELGKHYESVQTYRNELVHLLNKKGKQAKNWKTISSHHVLVDVPDKGIDQYGDVSVSYPRSVEGKKFYSLREVSQISKAVTESFSVYTKKVRLFCHPKYINQINSLRVHINEIINEAWKVI